MMEQLEKECNDGNQEQQQQEAAAGGKTAATTTAATTETATATAAAQPRISARWTTDENQVALLALRDWGKNFAVSN